MKEAPVTPRTISVNSRVQETGGPRGNAQVTAQLAGHLRDRRDAYQQQAIENAYIKGQTTLSRDMQDIETRYKNDPDGLAEALEDYSTSFLEEVGDANMAARFELQITKVTQSALARATAGRNQIITEQARFDNLQGFDEIKNRIPQVSRSLLSDDPAVALAATEELQEMLTRGADIMGATDPDGQPIFNAAYRVKQLSDAKDSAIQTAVIDRLTRSQTPMSEIEAFKKGEVFLTLPNSGESTMKVSNRLMSDLQKELGIDETVAAGIVGNLAHESGGFMQLQEIAPMVEGSRGGYGFAQWTGPRREAFEKWAKDKGLAPESYEANKGFLIHELKNTSESKVLGKLKGVSDVQEAAQIFSDEFLRPGIPHIERRKAWAQKIFDTENDNVDLVNVRDSVSEQSAKFILAAADSHIAEIEAVQQQQRQVVSSQIELAIETVQDDPAFIEQPTGTAGPPQPGQSKAEKLAGILQAIDNNPLYNTTADGVVKGNQLREKVFAKLKKEQEQFELINAGSAFAGGNAFLNRQDTKAVQAYDKYYESIEGGLSQLEPFERNMAITAIVDNAKAVPSRLTGDIQRIARSNDVDQIAQAADLIDRIGAQNPHLIGDIAPQKDLARIQMINSRVNQGYEPDEAMQKVDDLLDPRNEITIGEATAELKERKVDYRAQAVQAFDSAGLFKEIFTLGFADGLSPDDPVQKPMVDGLTAAYRVAYEDHYRITRDADLSQQYATKFVQGRYGVTTVNGGNQIMPFAPEKYYSITGEKNDWMREQAIEQAMKATKNTLNPPDKRDLKKNLYVLPDPYVTPRTAKQGAPRYKLMYRRQDGSLMDVLGPNQYFFFEPDIRREQLIKEAQEPDVGSPMSFGVTNPAAFMGGLDGR